MHHWHLLPIPRLDKEDPTECRWCSRDAAHRGQKGQSLGRQKPWSGPARAKRTAREWNERARYLDK